jgi:hypothetical protein
MSRLLDALRKAQELRDRQRASNLPETIDTPARQVEESRAAEADAAAERNSRAPRSPVVALALTAAILLATWLAWHEQPWRAPVRMKIDPAALKLDRHLDSASPRGTP